MARIVAFEDLSEADREAAAQLLKDVFAVQAPDAWNTIEEAREEVESFFTVPERRAWACLEGERLVGWIGRIHTYDGNVWELHPMLVAPEFQRRGLGRLLAETLEEAARAAGVLTIQLGADDETGGTNLFGADLYPDIWRHIRDVGPTSGHQISFYRKLGYVVSGLVPDANGFGKPDIIMAKRIGPRPRNLDPLGKRLYHPRFAAPARRAFFLAARRNQAITRLVLLSRLGPSSAGSEGDLRASWRSGGKPSG